MQERSMEVELNDDLDKACKPALGLFCSENEMGVGTEFLCLQEHFDDLVKDRVEYFVVVEKLDMW